MPHYTARKITETLEINGDLTKSAWQSATWSPRFVDMTTGGAALYDTRTALLWNDQFLYIAFVAEEPFLEAHLTERDSIIFRENDLEVLIDGGDCYYELEVNARNTVYEVFFIWRDAYLKGGRFDVPLFDVHHPQAMTFGGNFDRDEATFWYGNHPRGLRWAFLNYDLPGLQTAVGLDGSLNDNRDIDRGWRLEIAIPWQSLTWLANGRSLPPKNGDLWRIFLGRFQKIPVSRTVAQQAMVLTPHGVNDTHQPESWSEVEFRN